MIEFNEKDYNLKKIRIDSKLFNLLTTYSYRVYGLLQENNPPVLIEFNSNVVDDKFNEKLKIIDKFFEENQIKCISEDSEDGNKIFIGLRKDIRKHVILCSSILQTIVYGLENRLVIKKGFKIDNVPSLCSNSIVENTTVKPVVNSSISVNSDSTSDFLQRWSDEVRRNDLP
jgi:hypothetical protein